MKCTVSHVNTYFTYYLPGKTKAQLSYYCKSLLKAPFYYSSCQGGKVIERRSWHMLTVTTYADF